MSPKRIRLLIWKEFTQLRRDPLLIRLLLLMPVLQLILFGYVVAVVTQVLIFPNFGLHMTLAH